MSLFSDKVTPRQYKRLMDAVDKLASGDIPTEPWNITIPCDTRELVACDTTSISQLDQAYVASLREQLQQARICILEAQMYLSIGATERAQATLNQGLNVVNADNYAFPLLVSAGLNEVHEGLTKREYFAVAIFSALLSGGYSAPQNKETAKTAVAAADNLLSALSI